MNMIPKYIKIAAYVIEAAIVVTLIALAIATGAKSRTIKAQKAEIANLQEQVDSLSKYNKQLAGINGINVEVTFQFTQKNVLSFSANNCQNIAKEVAQMTRGEILDSLLLNNK